MKAAFSITGLLILAVIAIWAWYGGFNNVTPVINHTNSFIIVSEKDGLLDQNKNSHWGTISQNLQGCIDCNSSSTAFYVKCTSYSESEPLRGSHFCGLMLQNTDLIAESLDMEKVRIVRFEEGNMISIATPYKGKLSVAFAIMRAYPALRLFCAKNNIALDKPILEIYNAKEERIEICMLLGEMVDS